MKPAVAMLIILFSCGFVMGQSAWGESHYGINFEDSTQLYRLDLDTITNSNNVWQIGEPNKMVFSQSYSIPNAIVTDLDSAYPPNDTSSFTVTHIASVFNGFEYGQVACISGVYKVDCDTITDFGRIEFSPDNGASWIDLIEDSVFINDIQWYSERAILSGSRDWTSFEVCFGGLGPHFGILTGDTVLYRFTFVSDSIHTGRDGLMFDNLIFEDWAMGIEETSRSYFSTKAFPIPSRNDLQITFENLTSELSEIIVFDGFGRAIFQQQTSDAGASFSISDLETGIYYYSVTKLKSREVGYGRFVRN